MRRLGGILPHGAAHKTERINCFRYALMPCNYSVVTVIMAGLTNGSHIIEAKPVFSVNHPIIFWANFKFIAATKISAAMNIATFHHTFFIVKKHLYKIHKHIEYQSGSMSNKSAKPIISSIS